MENIKYGGFGVRLLASLIDGFLILFITVPLMLWIYGWNAIVANDSFVMGSADVVVNYILPFVLYMVAWTKYLTTPGKAALRMRIVDAKTGGEPSLMQFVIRYLGYFLSTLPLFLGFLWVLFDRRKQGWHDKLADTVVIRETGEEPVRFDGTVKKGMVS